MSRPTPASSRVLLGPCVFMVIFLGPSWLLLDNFPTGEQEVAAMWGAVSVPVWWRCSSWLWVHSVGALWARLWGLVPSHLHFQISPVSTVESRREKQVWRWEGKVVSPAMETSSGRGAPEFGKWARRGKVPLEGESCPHPTPTSITSRSCVGWSVGLGGEPSERAAGCQACTP